MSLLWQSIGAGDFQAINFRLITLYADPVGPVATVATDETAWTGVMASQSQTSVGTIAWDR